MCPSCLKELLGLTIHEGSVVIAARATLNKGGPEPVNRALGGVRDTLYLHWAR